MPEELLTPAERARVQALRSGLEPGHRLKLELQHMQQALRAAVDALAAHLDESSLEALGAEALRESGAVGVRRYAVGQPLTVRVGGTWRDADVEAAVGGAVEGVVGAAHRVRLLDGAHHNAFGGDAHHNASGGGAQPTVLLGLHPWNHAPRELPGSDFEALRAWWAA